jgi:Bacterial extracellular solute-binding proteins, family 5 Middle.
VHEGSIRLIAGIVLVSYLTIVNPIGSEVVLRAQQYNITPYNTLYMFIIESPPITSMSVYNPNIFHGGLATYGLVQDFLASLNITSNTMVPDLAGWWNWTVLPNGTLEVLFNLRHTGWNNGELVTCNDVYATNLMLGLVDDMAGNLTIINDTTCAFMVPSGFYLPPTSPGNVIDDLFGTLDWGRVALVWSYSAWKPLVEAATANYSQVYLYNFGPPSVASSAEHNISSLINELFTLKPTYSPSMAFYNGPFYVCDVTPEYILLCKNPYFYAANQIPVQYIVLYQYASMAQVYAALATGKLSYWQTGGTSISPTLLPQILSNPYIKMYIYPAFGGDALYFNFLNPWLRITQVRQAIYYAVNWTELAQSAYGPLILPSPMPQVGLNPVYYEQWLVNTSKYWASLGPEWAYVNYTYNPSLAAQLLESVGFKKVNGIWYTPNGTQFTLTLYISSSAAPPQLTLANEIANALTSFGIPTTVVTFPSSEYKTIVQKGAV